MPKPFTINALSGFRFSRRAIAFLLSDSDPEINAAQTFYGLTGKVEREVRVSIDQWLQGNDNCPRRFHGFTKAGYRQCLTFKWRVKRLEHRLYGFLCNPRPDSDRAFRLCVLIYHAVKTEWKTDEAILDRVNRLHTDIRVTEAIQDQYPEHQGYKTWLRQ